MTLLTTKQSPRIIAKGSGITENLYKKNLDESIYRNLIRIHNIRGFAVCVNIANKIINLSPY